MRLYYCQSFDYNFGDDLNPWLWPQLIPDVLRRPDDGTLFVGIGTILNEEIPRAPHKIVFGSGVGYGKDPAIDGRWQIMCVRGPRTAARLGLEKGLAITDAAALIRMVHLPAPALSGATAFMPHHVSASRADWKSISAEAGLAYIDPREPVEQILSRLRGTRSLVAEAMHGAIVADALRIPWTPVACYDHINTFKWLDWCESLDVGYHPTIVQPVIESFSRRPMELLRHARALTRARHWEPLPRLQVGVDVTPSSARKAAITALRLCAQGQFYLSSDSAIERATERLAEKLETVRSLPVRRCDDLP